MQASGQRVQVFKAHLSDGNSKLSGFIFSYLACHDFSAWQAVDGEAHDFVNSAEFCGIVVQDHMFLFLVLACLFSFREANPKRRPKAFRLISRGYLGKRHEPRQKRIEDESLATAQVEPLESKR